MFAIRVKKSKHKESADAGTFWRVTILESSTRLRVCRAIGKLESQATEQAMRLLQKRCGHSTPPPLASDGGSGCEDAMLEVYGQVPPYNGKRRRPKRKVAAADWMHLRLIKYLTSKPRKKIKRKVVFGSPKAVLPLLAKGTVKVERTHLTMRLSNGRLTRKTLGYSKKLENHKLSAAWEDLFYNLCHVVRTLKVKLNTTHNSKNNKRFRPQWLHQTPAMAAGLADHVWSVKELLKTISIHQHPSG
jgi:hypothetical protein